MRSILLAVGLWSVVTVAQSQPIPRADHDQHQANAAQTQAEKSKDGNSLSATGERPVGYTSGNNPQRKQERSRVARVLSGIGTWLAKFIEDPIAVFTALLFVFTAMLWYVTYRLSVDARRSSRCQYIQTRQALRLARQEFIATHRPEILIHALERLEPIEGDEYGLLRARLIYANIGRTIAQIERIEASIFSSSAPVRGARPGANIPVGTRQLASGARDSFDLNFLPNQTTLNTLDVYCVGVIVYRDGSSNRRDTGFIRMFHPGQNQWIRVEGENEYDYQY